MSNDMNEQQAQGYFLQALHAELLRVLPAKCHKRLDSWMENGTIKLEPKNMGPTGVNVAWLTYQAVFTIEQLPFRELDPAILLATVAAWVQEHDDYREQYELPDPEYAAPRMTSRPRISRSSSPLPSRCAWLSTSRAPSTGMANAGTWPPMTSGWPTIST
ncbi:phage protein [Aeromonas encheleia]|nr:phage protein [Aeromonas encheleia]